MSIFDGHSTRRFLLIGSPPTPNGRAHLGHVAGPFLRLDVFARYRRSLGDEALVMSGSDPYDSFVLLSARREQRSPEEVAVHYRAAIEGDLRALDIDLAAFVDPALEPWRTSYRRLVTESAERLIARGSAESRSEQVLYASVSDRCVVGCWLLGRCPDCGAEAGSYFCEQCGAFFRPESILDPKPRFDEGPMEWRSVELVYLLVRQRARLVDHWLSMGISPDFHAAGLKYIDAHGATFPITQPGTWGVSWRPGSRGIPTVLFTYAAMHPFLVLFGDEYGAITGRNQNAFDPLAGVTTVVAFGLDNLIPYLVAGIGVAIEDGRTKPCDHYLINHFYELEGAKFSTSRGHVIWGLDITRDTPASPDAIRCYLIKVNPEHGPASFSTQDFVNFTNTFLVDNLSRRVDRRRRKALGQPPMAPDGRLVHELAALLNERDKALDLRRFDLAGSLVQLEKWLAVDDGVGDDGSTAYWWLKGLALLAYPLMPRFGAALWTSLGHSGSPTTAAFTERTTPNTSAQFPRFTALRHNDLDPCLPKTLVLSK